jgi:hypothetical protein
VRSFRSVGQGADGVIVRSESASDQANVLWIWQASAALDSRDLGLAHTHHGGEFGASDPLGAAHARQDDTYRFICVVGGAESGRQLGTSLQRFE